MTRCTRGSESNTGCQPRGRRVHRWRQRTVVCRPSSSGWPRSATSYNMCRVLGVAAQRVLCVAAAAAERSPSRGSTPSGDDQAVVTGERHGVRLPQGHRRPARPGRTLPQASRGAAGSRRSRRTTWIDSSTWPSPTRTGSPTSPTSARTRAGCTRRCVLTPGRGLGDAGPEMHADLVRQGLLAAVWQASQAGARPDAALGPGQSVLRHRVAGVPEGMGSNASS